MSLNLNICRNLLFLCICPPKLSPSNCFFVSWCPLMLGWENTPRAWKHPHQFGEGRGIEREKPILRFWRVSSTGHDRKVPWGSTPEGARLPPSFLLRSFNSTAVTTTCARKAAEKLFWPVAMSTALPLPAESQALVGMATLLKAPKDAGSETGSLEKALGYQWRWQLLCQRVWGAGKTHAITHLFGKLFCRIKWVLGG